MNTTKSTLAEHRKKFSEAIKEAKLGGMDAFQYWFDRAENVNQAVVRGYWDFAVHILTPRVCEYIQNPEDKVALEIGYGGGRILNAACSFFKEAIGIDIHDEKEFVENFLKSQGKSNFQLIKTSGDTIDVSSESIDLIYSFIVLQHLPSFGVFEKYIEETYRSLKKAGIAQLYFGSFSYWKLTSKDQKRYARLGFREFKDVSPREISLVVHLKKIKKLVEGIGFQIVETGHSYMKVPDGFPNSRGHQDYVTLFKK